MAKAKRIMLILGSGLYDIYGRQAEREILIKTGYGSASVQKLGGSAAGEVFLLRRHGKGHTLAPHMINYRANISAAQKLGIDYIIATSAVGSMNPKIRVGDYVVVDQFIDFTKSRQSTFFGSEGDVRHTDMSHPYSDIVRSSLLSALKSAKVRFAAKGTYVCTEGPRYESAAEIRMFRKVGGDVAGMTGVPEVVLADELGIPYGSIAHVTNMCSGMQSELSHGEVLKEMKKSLPQTKKVLDHAINELSASSNGP